MNCEGTGVVIVLVGNKADLGDSRAVSKAAAEQFAEGEFSANRCLPRWFSLEASKRCLSKWRIKVAHALPPFKVAHPPPRLDHVFWFSPLPPPLFPLALLKHTLCSSTAPRFTATEQGIMYYETSALSGSNVNAAFDGLFDRIVTVHHDGNGDGQGNGGGGGAGLAHGIAPAGGGAAAGTVTLDGNASGRKQKGSCC